MRSVLDSVYATAQNTRTRTSLYTLPFKHSFFPFKIIVQKTGKIKNVRNIHAHIQPTPACDAIQSSDDIGSVSDSISSGVTFTSGLLFVINWKLEFVKDQIQNGHGLLKHGVHSGCSDVIDAHHVQIRGACQHPQRDSQHQFRS